ncbi:MAG: amino acid permease [Candidatus Solibacter usitatus]|nr:amino acid permease [Candidatus Solibacter usitatus]
MLVSLAICTTLYILVALLLTGVTHYSRLNVAAPVALAIDATGAKWGSLLVKLGTVMGLSTTMLVTLLGQSRVFYSMSRDGLLPPWAGRVHPRFLTPWISSLVVGLCVALCAALVPIETLGQLVSIGTLLAFTIVCAAVWILRRTHPGLPRPFRAPLVPLVPILGMISSLTLMATLPIETWMRLLVWLAIGMVIYLAYGRHHSRLGVRCEV